jgi:hypothetical protein
MDGEARLRSVKVERVPLATIEELAMLKREAKDAGKAYTEAVDEQAKRYRLKPRALNRYITAHEADKVHELRSETESPQGLLALE